METIEPGNITLQNDREKAAMGALLTAHPKWGKRPVSINDCLKSRVVPMGLKEDYLAVILRNPRNGYLMDIAQQYPLLKFAFDCSRQSGRNVAVRISGSSFENHYRIFSGIKRIGGETLVFVNEINDWEKIEPEAKILFLNSAGTIDG